MLVADGGWCPKPTYPRPEIARGSQLDLTIENARKPIAAVSVNKEPMFLTLNTGPDALAFARKPPQPSALNTTS